MNIEKQIEFDKVKELWMNLAVTEGAKEQIRETTVCLSEAELRKRLRETGDARTFMEKRGMPPLQNVTEIKEIMEAARKGDCLTPYQLERVEKVLVSIKRLKDYLARGKDDGNTLAYYEENLDAAEELREEIGRQIRGGAVDDYASRELCQLRGSITRSEEQMRQKAEQTLHANKQYLADHYCTVRNGRICIPVKKEYCAKIAGSVIDKSATGNTLFIEPKGAAKCFEEMQMLKISEENEVYRILYTLTAMTAEWETVLDENIAMIVRLDFIFSKGKLSMDMQAFEPSLNTERRILLKDARHPLMDREKNVPLQFEIGAHVQGIVITGPNTGGKTVAIKTVMLNCMMAQCGLHVTCQKADICINSAYLCDIGDGQNLSENLSTFSAHIKNVLEVLRMADQNSLVVLDELGSGTDPAEGMGIAIAILEELRKSKTAFLVTTHYPEVKEYAEQTEGIVNARMAFDKDTLKPTYQMVIGEAGESCAFYIADRLGMPNEMLRTAIKAAYGAQAVNTYSFQKKDSEIKKIHSQRISRIKKTKNTELPGGMFQLGDSVMVYPDKKIGIVCQTVNEKGVLRVQMPDKKIWINHKRVKLHVHAAELYPEDYDFSIIFETVEDRKIRHDMERKYTAETIQKPAAEV
ncbi:MAG: DNA mismatch repair protein MutS [Lachnospiraceae bacterium]|nr:DNA mismatch repair protein MutS [Lachnospiraceae bacterium]